jgi:hypothetical protein
VGGGKRAREEERATRSRFATALLCAVCGVPLALATLRA